MPPQPTTVAGAFLSTVARSGDREVCRLCSELKPHLTDLLSSSGQ